MRSVSSGTVLDSKRGWRARLCTTPHWQDTQPPLLLIISNLHDIYNIDITHKLRRTFITSEVLPTLLTRSRLTQQFYVLPFNKAFFLRDCHSALVFFIMIAVLHGTTDVDAMTLAFPSQPAMTHEGPQTDSHPKVPTNTPYQ